MKLLKKDRICSEYISSGRIYGYVHSIPFGDLEILQKLLFTNRVGGKPVDYNEKIGYFFMYDNNLSRPYPSVIIWRYEKRDGQSVIVDVKQEDLRAVQYAYEIFLTPSES